MNYSRVDMVNKIIAHHDADKEALLSKVITDEGMISQMCLIVSFINEYIFYTQNHQKWNMYSVLF